MNSQSDLLEKEDPRYYAIDQINIIDELNADICIIALATTEKIDKKHVNFGLPSSTALFLNSALSVRKQVMSIKIDDCFNIHPEGLWPDDSKLLFDFFELMILQIICSYSAIETFANVMINQAAKEDYIYRVIKKNGKQEEFNKEQAERLKLEVKLDKILPDILFVKSPKGKKIWEKFRHLEKLRDRLIHLKSTDMQPSGPENKSIWGDLIRNHQTNFSEQAHELMGHYLAGKQSPRWFKKFTS
jgi:hypothetical protein